MYLGNQPTQAQVAQTVANRLLNLRTALDAAADLYQWSSGLAAADLQGLGFSAADAQSMLSALADANALHQIYETGLPPATYPQPAQAYVYGASQRTVIGAQ